MIGVLSCSSCRCDLYQWKNRSQKRFQEELNEKERIREITVPIFKKPSTVTFRNGLPISITTSTLGVDTDPEILLQGIFFSSSCSPIHLSPSLSRFLSYNRMSLDSTNISFVLAPGPRFLSYNHMSLDSTNISFVSGAPGPGDGRIKKFMRFMLDKKDTAPQLDIIKRICILKITQRWLYDQTN